MNRLFYTICIGLFFIQSLSGKPVPQLFSFNQETHFFSPLSSTIGDRVWLDRNGNGMQDGGEPGIAGVTVLLFNQQDLFVGIKTTDNSGYFQFSGINSGQYRLKFPQIEGLKITRKGQGSPGIDSDINQDGYTQLIYIGENQSNLNIDAGYSGNMTVSMTSSISSCAGNPVTLSAQPVNGKPPYMYNWSHGLGTGNPKTLTPPTGVTTYRVTITDFWGSQKVATSTVRVKAAVGEENCHVIDDFFNGHNGIFTMEVNPIDPGPKSVVQTASIGLLGGSRKITFQHISGMLPANILVDFTTGAFTNSNDVGTISKTTLCYNDFGQGLNFDIRAFDYLKFKEIAVDQGGLNVKVSLWDGSKRITTEKEIPGLGTNAAYNREVVFAEIDDFLTLNLQQIQEICFEFNTEEESVDFQLAALMVCKTTDCELSMGEELHICAGESVEIHADVPCAEQLVYQWDNGLSNKDKHIVSPMQTTVYNVAVVDVNGCSVTGSVRVNVHPKPDVILPQSIEVCHGQNFSIVPAYTGGTLPYRYQWNNGSQLPSLTDITASANSMYKITVTDLHSCTDSASVQLVVLEQPELSFTTVPADCQQANGSATAIVSKGLPPYTYRWSNGDTDAILNNVGVGFYQVTVTDTKGCQTISQVFVSELFCAKIGDYVWHDLNADGIQNSGEPGVSGVRVELMDQAQQMISFTFTNENGYYLFSALAPGNYYVRFIKPGGYHFSPALQGTDPLKDSNPDPATGLSPLINLANYQENLSVDAGIYQYGRIGDFVWLDNNGNGMQNTGESGVANVQVSLLNCNGNVLRTATTDASGYYTFDNLVPGQYKVRFIDPSGMKFITPNQGNDPALDSDAAILNGETNCISLISNQINNTLDAGLYVPAKLGDKVWVDLNANGQQGTDEPGLSNFEVRLLNCNNVVLKTTFTNDQGLYLFDDLLPGSYKIGIGSTGIYGLSPFQVGDPATDSNIDPATNTSVCEVLESGENNLTYDIGLFQRAAIGDFVWVDGNGNGSQDTGENGYPGMVVQLFDCNNNYLAQTTTNGTGYYNFSNLIPGNYSVKFVLSGNWYFTQAGTNNSNGSDSNADPITGFTGCETLISGEINQTYDAGIYQRGSVGDYVWDDLNGNGLQDSGEPGVPNFKVILKTCAGSVVQTKFTDQYGYYLFNNLVPGEYLLDFSQNSEAYFTAKNQGSNTAIDSDVHQNTGQTSCFSVQSGSTNLTMDAGLLKVASVGDFVWEDINGNGIQDSGEPGIAGILMKLFKVNTNGTVLYAETTTNASGNYLFQNLPAGTYHIKIHLGGTNWQVTLPKVYSDFVDSDITHTNGWNSTNNFLLLPGQHNPHIDAGLFECAEIGDLVWCDFTHNHHWQPGENGINGVEVELYRNVENTWVYWTTIFTGNNPGSTPADGHWSACVNPGEYYVKYNLPANSNFLLVDPFIGGNSEYDSDVTNAFGYGTTDAFIVSSGDVKTDLGAGYYYGSIIGDRIWYDTNQNGIQDAGEPSASGILVEIFNASGKVGQKITNSNGSYIIDNLPPDSYYLKFSPGNHSFTAADQGSSDHLDSDVTHTNGQGTTDWFEVGIQEINYSFDAGLVNSAQGMQWYDQGGEFKGEYNEIWWETIGEEQLDRFELHRLHPGSDQYELLEIIQPKGDRNFLQKYQAKDFDNEETGMYKYRVLSKDIFSNTTFSPEILINVFGEMKLMLYPNPASDKINLGFYNRRIEEISILVFNNLGVLVKSYENIQLDKNSVFLKEIQLADLPAGNYHVKISSKDLNWNANISVMR